MSLTAFDCCLAEALADLVPCAAEDVPLPIAKGHVLAQDAVLPGDRPATQEALRAGFAVSSLDLVGASPQIPLTLGAAPHVLPGMALPAGADAVLPDDGTESSDGVRAAIRPVDPGEGIRRAGHDGRAGDLLLPAGRRVGPRQALAAERAGVARLSVRRPRIRIDLPDPALASFATGWFCDLGAIAVTDAADLIVRAARDHHQPRLALAPAETAWLGREGAELMLTTPTRFDGLITALLGLALPALAALSGATLRSTSWPLARNLPSAIGMAELVLLSRDGACWSAVPPGFISLHGLVRADAFAILPADSEGFAAGTPLAATPIDAAFE